MTLHILLVDDSEQFRTVVGQFLSGEEAPDMQVVGEASDANTAIQQAQALEPDVVAIDVKMPNTDGIEATSRILKLVPSVKVLALSLHVQAELIQAMIDAGASGYVSKEDAYEELLPAIRAVAAGENYFSASLPPPFGAGEDPDGIADDH
jgi:DNA-binding NarL/FixJ family response regulator